MNKIQIKNYITGAVIYEHEEEDNTIKKTVDAAVRDDANLSGANLSGANLCRANLYDANLSGANLCRAKNTHFIPLACPSDGEFTAWKKVCNCLVELYIPDTARRSSATTNKCRCDKAKVISITDLRTGESVEKVTNNKYAPTIYEVGCWVTPDSFDENRWNECSHGIHFFINKQEAINY